MPRTVRKVTTVEEVRQAAVSRLDVFRDWVLTEPISHYIPVLAATVPLHRVQRVRAFRHGVFVGNKSRALVLYNKSRRLRHLRHRIEQNSANGSACADFFRHLNSQADITRLEVRFLNGQAFKEALGQAFGPGFQGSNSSVTAGELERNWRHLPHLFAASVKRYALLDTPSVMEQALMAALEKASKAELVMAGKRKRNRTDTKSLVWNQPVRAVDAAIVERLERLQWHARKQRQSIDLPLLSGMLGIGESNRLKAFAHWHTVHKIREYLKAETHLKPDYVSRFCSSLYQALLARTLLTDAQFLPRYRELYDGALGGLQMGSSRQSTVASQSMVASVNEVRMNWLGMSWAERLVRRLYPCAPQAIQRPEQEVPIPESIWESKRPRGRYQGLLEKLLKPKAFIKLKEVVLSRRLLHQICLRCY